MPASSHDQKPITRDGSIPLAIGWGFQSIPLVHAICLIGYPLGALGKRSVDDHSKHEGRSIIPLFDR